jgi:hypothetical protein
MAFRMALTIAQFSLIFIVRITFFIYFQFQLQNWKVFMHGNLIKFLWCISFLFFGTNLLSASAPGDDYTLQYGDLPQIRNDSKYWPENTKFLVIVHQYDGDVRWANHLNFPHIIYEKNKPEKEPFNAINKAKAETNLLKFIAQFYDDLPENVIQVYQYEYKSYHHGSLVDILNSPNFEEIYRTSLTSGFWNFNHTQMGYVDPQVPRMLESGWWPKAMAPWFGNIYDYGNFTMSKHCCAQFVVSRERIRSLPREFYVHMYFWLVNNTIDEVTVGFDPGSKTRISTHWDGHSNSNYHTSRYMEWSWELIFTSHKSYENIAVPVSIAKSNDSSRNETKLISALYGANKYQRDVTQKLITHFLHGDKIIIPSNVIFNDYFSDVVMFSEKTLIITVDGKEYKIPETRSIDTIISLL